jgi:hypothetical protein
LQQPRPAACKAAPASCSAWVAWPLRVVVVNWSSNIRHKQQLVSKGPTPVCTLEHTSKRSSRTVAVGDGMRAQPTWHDRRFCVIHSANIASLTLALYLLQHMHQFISQCLELCTGTWRVSASIGLMTASLSLHSLPTWLSSLQPAQTGLQVTLLCGACDSDTMTADAPA